MALIKFNNPILKQKSFDVGNLDYGRKTAKKIMLELNKHSIGVGMAAVQIGILERVFVMKYNEVTTFVINPTINRYSNNKVTREEGCLSYPNVYKQIERSVKIWVEYYNGTEIIEQKLSGFIARIFQHEYDHLDGICKVGDNG